MKDEGDTAGNETPKKRCEIIEAGEVCGREAAAAGFAPTETQMTADDGQVTAKARIAWVCEDHAGAYPHVPDRAAEVIGRVE